MATREQDAQVSRVLSWQGRVGETLGKPSPTSSFTEEKAEVQREESVLNFALCSGFSTIPVREDGHAEDREATLKEAAARGTGLLEFHQCGPSSFNTQTSAYPQPLLPTSYVHPHAAK